MVVVLLSLPLNPISSENILDLWAPSEQRTHRRKQSHPLLISRRRDAILASEIIHLQSFRIWKKSNYTQLQEGKRAEKCRCLLIITVSLA